MENEDPYTFECMKLHVIPKSTQKNKKRRLSKTSIQNARCTINSSQTSSRRETVQLSLNTVVKRHMAYTRVKYPFLLPSQIKGHALKELGLPNCMGDISFSFGNKKSLCKAPWTKSLTVNSLAIFNFSQLLRNFLSTALEHQNQSSASRKSNTSLQDISPASLDIFQVSNRDRGSNCFYTEKQSSRVTQRSEPPPSDLTSDDSHSNRNITFSPEVAEDTSVVSDSNQLTASQISASHLLQQRLNITQYETITLDKEIIFDSFESASKQRLFNSPKSVISLAEYKTKDANDFVRLSRGFLSVQELSTTAENEEHQIINVEESDVQDENCSDVSSVTSDSMLITPWRVKSPAIQKFKKIIANLTTVCTDPLDGLKFSVGLNSNGCNLLSMTETISISSHSLQCLSETDDEMSSDENGRESPTEQLLVINEKEHAGEKVTDFDTEGENDTDFETEPLHQSEILGVNEDEDSTSEISSIASLVHSPDKPDTPNDISVEAPNDLSSVALSNTPTSPLSSVEENTSECHSDLGYSPSLSTISSVVQVLEKSTSKDVDMKSQIEHSKLDHFSKENLEKLNLRGTPATPTNAGDKILSIDIQGSFKKHSSPETQIQSSTPVKINRKSHLNHEVSSDSKLTVECENTAVETQDDIITETPQDSMLVKENDVSTSDGMQMESNASNLMALENTNRDSPATTSAPETNETNSDWESDASLGSTDDHDITKPQKSSFSEIPKNTVQCDKTIKKIYKVSTGIHNKKAKKQRNFDGVSIEKMSQNLESNTKSQKEPTCKKSLAGAFSIEKGTEQAKDQVSALETNESINIKVSEGTPKINQSLQLSVSNEQCENEEVTYKNVAGKKNIKTKVSDAVYITESSPKQRIPLAELGVVTPEKSHQQQQALFKTPTTPYRTRFKSRISESEKTKQTIFTTAVAKRSLLSTPSPIQTCSKSRDPSDCEDDSNSEISDTHSLGQESDIAGSFVSNVTSQKSISETSEKSCLNKISNTKFAKVVSTPNLKRKFKDNTGNHELAATSTPKKRRNTNIGNNKNAGKKQVCFQGDDMSVSSGETDVDSLAKTQTCRISNTSKTSHAQQQTTVLQSPTIDQSTLSQLDPAMSVLSEETDVDSLAKTRVCKTSNISKTSHAQKRTTMLPSPTIDPPTLPQLDPAMSMLSEETDVDSLAKTRVRRTSNVSRTRYTQQQTTMLKSPNIDLSTLPQLDPNLKVSRYLSGLIGGSSQESYLSRLDSSDNETVRHSQSWAAASECSTTSFLVNMFEPLHPSKIQKKGCKKNQTNTAPKRG